MERLFNLKDKHWIKVSPLARINPEEWLVSIIKKGKVSWITDICKDGFATPEEGYDWAFEEIEKNNLDKLPPEGGQEGRY